jgi:hypothetical protein
VKIGVVMNPRAGGGRMDAAWLALGDALAMHVGVTAARGTPWRMRCANASLARRSRDLSQN